MSLRSGSVICAFAGKASSRTAAKLIHFCDMNIPSSNPWRRLRPLLVPHGAEFTVLVPIGPLLAVGQRQARQIDRIGVVGGPLHVPVGAPLVAGLVIAVIDIIVGQFLPRRDAAHQKIAPAVRRDRWYALLGQAEMVGAEEAAFFGLAVG